MDSNNQTNDKQENYNPTPPYIWPEPRILARVKHYQHKPPFHSIFDNATSFCGVTCDLDDKSINWLTKLMNDQEMIEGKIVLILYPACATKQEDLNKLLQFSNALGGRLEVRIYLLRFIEDIPFQSFLVMQDKGQPLFLFGHSGLNYSKDRPDRVNFVMLLDNPALESWTRWFNWFWCNETIELKSNIISIPLLYRPQGTVEGQQMWESYMDTCFRQDHMTTLKIDPETGDVVVDIPEEQKLDKDDAEIKQLEAEAQKKLPTIALRVPKIDPLTDEIARLFKCGELAIVDKTTRIKPLEVPISPRLFGDDAQNRSGLVTKQTQYRISIFEEKDQKRIKALIASISSVLNSFSYPLGDGVRWVPLSAKDCLHQEVDARNKEGSSLLLSLTKDGLDAFLLKMKPTFYNDANEMYQKLYPGQIIPQDDFEKIVEEVRLRLETALRGNILPKLSYLHTSFDLKEESDNTSAWGTAYSLIKSIARYPIDVASSGIYFERYFKVVKGKNVLKAMDIFNDPRLKDEQFLKDWQRAKKEELPKLEQVDKADVEPKEKCRALLTLIKTGDWEECNKIIAI